MKCEAKLPHWYEECAGMWVEHLKNAVQMISIVWKTKLNILDSTVESKILQSISKGGQYKVHHYNPPHVHCQVNPTRSSEIVS